MKTLKFLTQKIVIIEVMLIILFFACSLFNINIDGLTPNSLSKIDTPLPQKHTILYLKKNKKSRFSRLLLF